MSANDINYCENAHCSNAKRDLERPEIIKQNIAENITNYIVHQSRGRNKEHK